MKLGLLQIWEYKGVLRLPKEIIFITSLNGQKYVFTNDNSTAESSGSSIFWDYMNGVMDYFSSASYRSWNWRRAPGFFDTVMYTGNGSNRTISHNLGVTPEMMWIMPLSLDLPKLFI